MIDYKTAEPQKYWAMPSSYTKEKRLQHIDQMIDSGDYLASLKTDGNWSRAIIDGKNSVLQTRGISKSTNTYGEVQDKVFFWDSIVSSFSKTTCFIGELYLDGGIDRHVGSILRSLQPKAIATQDTEYINFYKPSLSKKDLEDINNNEFKDNKIKLRIFDVLCYEGLELQNKALTERIKYIDIIVKKINNPLVSGVEYFNADNTLYQRLSDIFASGGEGVVLYRKDGNYEFGSRTAWKTCKIKQEIQNDIDVFITGVEPAIEKYTGKDIQGWMYWKDIKTEETFFSDMFGAYVLGRSIIPITKGHFYGWPGSLICSVYDKYGNVKQICKVSNLTDEMKEDICSNYASNWLNKCVTIGGMLISTAKGDTNISIRHPYIKSIRDDLDKKDCLLSKIIDE